MHDANPLVLLFATLAEAQPLLAAVGGRPLAGRAYDAYVAAPSARARPVLVAITGMGLCAAETTLAVVLAHERPTGVVNAGIAGALHGRLGIGDVLHVTGVAETDGEVVASDDFLPIDNQAFAWLVPDAAPVRLVSRREPLFDTALRDRLAETADLVDMEGARIAAGCAAAGVPCALLKAVSDYASDRATLLRNLEHGARRLTDRLAPLLRHGV